jgi:hypothetical protein
VDVIDLVSNLIERAQSVVVAFVALMAIAMVVATWVRSRAFVPTLGAVLFGMFVTWAVHNVDFVERQIGEDMVTQSGD